MSDSPSRAKMVGFVVEKHFGIIDPAIVAEAKAHGHITIDEAVTTIEWLAKNYKQTLAGKAVKDADECLSAADILIKKYRG
jgi:Mg/Co/Ni transporter MgtE